jgi:EAL domain-containing protein (putative c-di-GMP-specific phosphodiesterase class I)
VDELKVDRSFVAKLGRNYEDTTLISLMVIPAYSLGLKVVAEGVEKYYQLRPLRELGCDRAQ